MLINWPSFWSVDNFNLWIQFLSIKKLLFILISRHILPVDFFISKSNVWQNILWFNIWSVGLSPTNCLCSVDLLFLSFYLLIYITSFGSVLLLLNLLIYILICGFESSFDWKFVWYCLISWSNIKNFEMIFICKNFDFLIKFSIFLSKFSFATSAN